MVDGEMQQRPGNSRVPEVDEGAGVDYVGILLRWKRFIVLNFLVVVLVAIAISLILPKWYKATTSILPPKDQGLMSLLGAPMSAIRSLPLAGRLGGLGQNSGVYNYLAILKSRTSLEAIARKFDLIKVYGVADSSTEKTIKELQDNVVFEMQEENYLTIDVLDKDPNRAADMANYFVEMLNVISIQLATLEARNNRDFIEKRLNDIKDELHRAEDALKSFQEKSGIMIAPEQISSGISAVAELYGMKARKEIEIAILSRSVTPDNLLLRQLEAELAEINKKAMKVPGAGIESFRLFRDVAIQQKIVEYLVPLYEQAKIDEQKDVPVILVLDKAVPPEKKEKPKRLVIVASAAFSSILISFSVVLFSFYLETFRRKRFDDYRRLRSMFVRSRRT